jgi:haloalkane dehalogenase
MKQRIAFGLCWLLVISGTALGAEAKPGVLRTPDERFENLPGYDFEPHYAEINGYRVHYLDEGPRQGKVVLMLHGEPSWAYLYRKMIPIISDAGYRAVAPDLLGFGRSDKPVKREDYSYQLQVDIVTELIKRLDLKNITLFCQDWGGLVGLRVAAENEDRFVRIIAANTGLPAGDQPDGLIIGTQFTNLIPMPRCVWRAGFSSG